MTNVHVQRTFVRHGFPLIKNCCDFVTSNRPSGIADKQLKNVKFNSCNVDNATRPAYLPVTRIEF